MPYVTVDDVRLYYEFLGDEDKPLLLQFGGSVLGRHHFDAVNDRFLEHFRILGYDLRGYGLSDRPKERYTVEGWADEAAGLLRALGIERTLVLGSSGGGMNALAFAVKYPEMTIALCADCCYARPDLTRRTQFRLWRQMLESMPTDAVSDTIIIQVLSPAFLEANEAWLELGRHGMAAVSRDTLGQSFLAQETMDLEPLIANINFPTLMTNFDRDVLCPPELAPSGFAAQDIAAAVPDHVRSEVLSGQGHAPLVEAADTVVPMMVDFLRVHADGTTLRV
jgi:pimeloyl-ACP methyl ester carboxylesterase